MLATSSPDLGLEEADTEMVEWQSGIRRVQAFVRARCASVSLTRETQANQPTLVGLKTARCCRQHHARSSGAEFRSRRLLIVARNRLGHQSRTSRVATNARRPLFTRGTLVVAIIQSRFKLRQSSRKLIQSRPMRRRAAVFDDVRQIVLDDGGRQLRRQGFLRDELPRHCALPSSRA